MKWLIVENKWKIIYYTNHHALNSIMIKNLNEYNCIATWQDWLKEYDIKIVYKSITDFMINITNELNKLFMKLIIKYRIKNQNKSSFMSEKNEEKSDETNETNEKKTQIIIKYDERKDDNELIEKQKKEIAKRIIIIIVSKN